MSARIDLDGLVNGVVDRLAGRLGKRAGIFILASPGCSRGRLVTVLLRRGLVDVVYAYGGFGSKVGDDVRGRVNEFGSIDELAGKLGSVNGRVAVVARSTTDAIRLRDRLGNAEVIYLPKYYEDTAKEALSGGTPGVAGVRHEGLGKGISPSMLREGVPSEVVESIRELSLGKVSFGDLIKDFLKKASGDAAVQAITLGLSFLLGTGVAVSLVSSLVGSFLEMVVGRWRRNRDEVIGGFVRLVRVAREVNKNYLCNERNERLCDERFEAVFDEVAYEWGLGIEEFTNTITNIANITAKQLTEEDIKRIINDKLEGIEEALKKIEEELREVRERVRGLPAGVEVFFINDFEDGSVYPTVRLVDGELMVLGGYGYHEVVRTGLFSTLMNEVKQRLGAGSLVVLTGPKGVGKSTLAIVTTWELLRIGEVGMVLRIEELPDGEVVERFRSFIENFLVKDWEYFGNMIILYDPTGVYGQVGGVEAPNKLETTVRNVFEAVRRAVENARSILGREPSARVGVLIILPTDLYNALSNDVRDKLESYRLDAPLNDTEFLAGLIREYMKMRDKPNGCALSNDVLNKLTSELAKFDSGHALIARLVGEELVRNNCNVGEVEELINNAKDRAEAFIIQYINKLFKVDKDPNVAEALVEIFALRKPFIDEVKPGDPILTPGIVELIGKERRASLLQSAEGGELRGWLAIRQHDLIEGAIKKLLDCIVSENEECKNLGDALKPWVPGTVKLLKEISEKVSDVDSTVKYFASKYGEKFTDALKVFSNCWKRAALIIGHALAGDPIAPRLKNLSVFLPENLRNLSKSDIEFLGYALSRLGFDVDEIQSLIMNLSKYSASVVEFLGDALKECGVDYYLFVGDEIPPLIRYLTKDYAYALAEAFVDRYNEVVAEVRRVLNIIKNRSDLYNDEVLYSLGLALIIANTAGLGRPIEPSDADATLHIVSSAMHHVISFTSLSLIKPVLSALVPLRDKAPQRYLEVLASALGKVSTPDILGFMCPDLDTVMYILNEFDYILNKYRDGVKGHAWTLVDAINASINSLYKCLKDCDDYMFERMDASFRTKLEHIVSRVAGLLDEINRLNHSLGIIAWAHALPPALDNKCVRALMENVLGIDVADKAKEVVGELSRLRAQELIRDEGFMGFVKSWLAEADEKAAREILEDASIFVYILAQDKLDNDELKEAEELFNGAAEWGRVVGVYKNYLDSSNWALRVEAIKGSLAGDDLVKLVNGFKQLYEEAVNAERLMPAEVSPYYDTLPKNILKDILENILSDILGGYLVSLALTGGDEEIRRIEELLKEQWQVLNHHSLAPILTRLTLNALLRPRVELSSELKGKLVVKPWELMVYLGLGDIDINSLPVLRATYGTIKPGDEKRLCEGIDDLVHDLCIDNVSRAYSEELDQQAEGNLRQGLINVFQRWISKGEVLDLLKKLGLDAESLVNEFRGLIHELSGKSLQSVASFDYCSKDEQLRCSSAHLTYMLYALINGNEKLAKAHALYGAVSVAGKLPARLFLEAYRACCDLGNDEFRRAIARLFYYHV